MNHSKKKFGVVAVILIVFNLFCLFMYAGLQVEHMNVIQTFITEEGGGWSANMTMLPVTVGNLIAIVLTFVYGTLFIKVGIRKIMVPFMALTGLGCIGITLANGLDCFGGASAGSYPLFFVSLLVVRCCCPVFQMGGIMMLTNWFIKRRGRYAAIGSCGATLFTIVGTSLMPNVITKSLGGDARPFYYGITALIVIMIIVLIIFLRDTPEMAGFYPDGADHAPLSENDDQKVMTVKEVLRDKNAWKVTIALVPAQVLTASIMSSMAVNFMTLGGNELWLSATVFVSIGAILGMPCAFIFGVLNDKIGTVKSDLIFLLTMFIPVLALLFMPAKKSVVMLVILAIGLAFVLGGGPVLGPCLTAHVYGRVNYQSVNRIAFAISLLPAAFGGIMMTSLLTSGHRILAHLILVVIICIGIVAVLSLWKVPDANASDKVK